MVLNPKNCFAFIVGNCDDWDEEDRYEAGDIGFFRCLQAKQIPSEQLLLLKDATQCTRKNCQSQFVQFLKRTASDSHLIFYYGGHGHCTEFATHKGSWYHETVVKTAVEHFQGKSVLFIVDSCASGNFYLSLKEKERELPWDVMAWMNTPPYQSANDDGEKWPLIDPCITVMKQSQPLKLVDFLEFMADEHARWQRERVTVYHKFQPCNDKWEDRNLADWLPIVTTMNGDKLSSSNPSFQWMDPIAYVSSLSKPEYHPKQVIGENVYWKPSSSFQSQLPIFLLPLWYTATIESINSQRETVELHVHLDELRICTPSLQQQGAQPASSIITILNVPINTLLSDLYFCNFYIYQNSIVEAQCRIAKKHLQYIEYGAYVPVGTNVWVYWPKDKQRYRAIVTDWREMEWSKQAIMHHGRSNRNKGPQIPVWYVDEDLYSLVPLEHLFFTDGSVSEASTQSSQLPAAPTLRPIPTTPREALLQAIKCAGKSLVEVSTVFPDTFTRKNNNQKQLECFWPQGGKWYPTRALPLEKASLRDLVSHIDFMALGNYCLVDFPEEIGEEDDQPYLVPAQYLRLRQKQGGDDDNSANADADNDDEGERRCENCTISIIGKLRKALMRKLRLK